MHKPIKRITCLLFFMLICTISGISQIKKLDLQGHRGCRGLMPENTIEAMLKAISLGVNTIEMDVVITKDKKVVLSHDTYMNPEYTSPPPGIFFANGQDRSHLIYAMDYNEILLWDMGIKGNTKFPEQQKIPAKKPLLSDLIDQVEAYIKVNGLQPVHYNIETKSTPSSDGIQHPAPDEFIDLVMEVVQKKKISKRTTIQSFDKRTIQALNRKYPSIKTSYLIGASVKSGVKDLINDLGFKPDIISPDAKLVNPLFIAECRKLKVKVIVWTVNDTPTIKKMADWGVDGIISDYPDRFSILKSNE